MCWLLHYLKKPKTLNGSLIKLCNGKSIMINIILWTGDALCSPKLLSNSACKEENTIKM